MFSSYVKMKGIVPFIPVMEKNTFKTTVSGSATVSCPASVPGSRQDETQEKQIQYNNSDSAVHTLIHCMCYNGTFLHF